MRVVAVIQARMGSTRLPGKVLAAIGATTMLGQVVRRLRGARGVDEIVIATSTGGDDDAVVCEAGRLGAAVHRGPAADVLERFAGAARAYRAEAIVRVTADCPLLDPGVVEQVIGLLTAEVDYASNTHVRRFPRGLDVEVLHADTLARIARLGTSPAAREHVTAFVMEQPALFRIAQLGAEHDDSDLRWTVDTPDDLALVRALYAELSLDAAPRPYREVVAAVRARPELAAQNAHVVQKDWQEPHVA
ncbi:MAG TPA: glycosyltransferase family protein [Kofleriaceae bacterium]|nr:glycosyltransferase family protein [Kofleriaceae bacterium]